MPKEIPVVDDEEEFKDIMPESETVTVMNISP